MAAPLFAIALLSPVGAFAQGPVGCGYGSGGNQAASLCWIDMSGYDDAQARSPAGQPFTVSLPGGTTATFTVTTRDVAGFNSTTLEAVPFPTYVGSYLGNRAYVRTPGRPALHQTANVANAAVEVARLTSQSPTRSVTGWPGSGW